MRWSFGSLLLSITFTGCLQVVTSGATAAGTAATVGGSSNGGSGSSSAGGGCSAQNCASPRACCGAKCADLTTDTANCASCGHVCPAGQICQGSACESSPCLGASCSSGSACCGSACCDAAQVCCLVGGGASTWKCEATDGGCPPGCVPPNCPLSSKRYKKDISYLTEADRVRLHDDAVRLPLATFRYKAETSADNPRLGFMVEDATAPESVAAPGDRVDLYGYATMTVAAVQVQEEEIRALRKELAGLKSQLRAAPRGAALQPKRVSPQRLASP